MKKFKLLLTLILFLIGVAMCSAITLDNYQFCRGISVANWDNFSEPVGCVESTSEFLTTDEAAYIIAKLSSLEEGDKVAYEVRNPSGQIINDETLMVEQGLCCWYDFRKIEIASPGLPPGDYPVKLFINGNEAVSDKFTVIEDLSSECAALGFYCCPSSKVCLSAQEGECASGFCCESENQCKTFSPNYFTRREVTNCEEEGLNDCGRVVTLYDYSIHASINPPQTGVIYYKGANVDCGDRKDVAIAYYDEEAGAWVEKVTNIEETGVEDTYKATALLDYLGYVALIRTDECVPTLCTYAGYKTDPIGAYVNFGETLTFEFCGLVTGCEATQDGTCSRQCTDGVDPDCPECTAAQGDCCLISYDNLCDLDCAPSVDPDCCDKSKNLCCPAKPEVSGSQGCDKNCGTSDKLCSNCQPQGGNCCNAAKDGVCDPDCPKLSNGIGYLDVDCCILYGVPITSAQGDCCNRACDGICDPDCIVGLDPDCHGKGCCGDSVCQDSWGSTGAEDYYSCLSDCCYYDGTNYCYGYS